MEPTGVKLDLSQIISHPIVLAQHRRASVYEQQSKQQEPSGPEDDEEQPERRRPSQQQLTGQITPIKSRLMKHVEQEPARECKFAQSANSLGSANSTASSSPVEPLSMDSQASDELGLLRRSESILSNTCTLKRRPSRVAAYGVYTGELASPEPKVRLANFSITPYAESRRLKRRSYD